MKKLQDKDAVLKAYKLKQILITLLPAAALVAARLLCRQLP